MFDWPTDVAGRCIPFTNDFFPPVDNAYFDRWKIRVKDFIQNIVTQVAAYDFGEAM